MSRASFGNHDSARLALKAGRLQSANTVATVQLLQDGSESPRLRHESREHLKIRLGAGAAEQWTRMHGRERGNPRVWEGWRYDLA